MHARMLRGCKVDGAGSVSCIMAVLFVCDAEPSSCATTVLGS
jgi:hypothetical protein